MHTFCYTEKQRKSQRGITFDQEMSSILYAKLRTKVRVFKTVV